MRYEPLEERHVAIGVDLGQSRDPTTIAAVERVRLIVPGYVVDELRDSEHGRRRLVDLRKELPKPIFNLRILEQAPLGEAYPAQALRIHRVQANPNLQGQRVPVFVDYTGVGRAVFEIFRGANIRHMAGVTLTFNGQEGPNGQGGHSVPKLALVSRINALMHSGRLKMPAELPLKSTLHRELQDFRVSYTAAGNATFNALEGRHDDTLTAVGLALYGLSGEREASVEPLRM
ncbi:hypothetical protein [Pseudoxanthomonas sp. Soil82]|uniref:phage terminase large subunit family protein n=1 Tax=Pseudoxanthomonas sp. Soil82 TaxID=3157341 RepID=UPI00338F5A3A